MLRLDAWQAANPAVSPLPPIRHTLPTVPCDLSHYAEAETGPLSWSAIYDEVPCTLELDEPFDLDSWQGV